MNSWARAATGVVAAGAATVAYAAGIERRHWTLRQATLPVLPPGTRDIKVLHLSDLHMTPGQRSQAALGAPALAELEPDLVVDTGDNLAHAARRARRPRRAGPAAVDGPALFVFGSNDYFGPTFKNPARYLVPAWQKRVHGERTALAGSAAAPGRAGLAGPHEPPRARSMCAGGEASRSPALTTRTTGPGDYELIAGPADSDAVVRIGVARCPEPRILDAFAEDGYDLHPLRTHPWARPGPGASDSVR